LNDGISYEKELGISLAGHGLGLFKAVLMRFHTKKLCGEAVVKREVKGVLLKPCPGRPFPTPKPGTRLRLLTPW
jgi:hypothetical protein